VIKPVQGNNHILDDNQVNGYSLPETMLTPCDVDTYPIVIFINIKRLQLASAR
jgi:hypothetical protein